MPADPRNMQAELSSLVFSTDDLLPRDRLDAWNAAFGTLNEIDVAASEVFSPDVWTENWLLSGGVVLSETHVGGARFVRDPQRTRRDQFDHWVIRVIRRGQGCLIHPRFQTVTGPGDVVLFPASDTWTSDWHDVDWVSLCIPRDLDLRLTARLASVPPGRLQTPGSGLLADLMLALPTRVSRARLAEVPSLTGIILAAVSACLPEAPDGTVALEAGGTLAKERARRAILGNIGSSKLTPSFLAHSVGVSRSALYRIFEPEGGVSRFIRNTRLSMAYSALQSAAMMHKSIAVIAEEHGFPDPPEFSRAFRAAFGRTPREVRAAATTGETPALPIMRGPTGCADVPDMVSRIYAPASPRARTRVRPEQPRPCEKPIA